MKLTKKFEKIELKILENFKKEKKVEIQKKRMPRIKDITKNIKKKFLIITLNIVINLKIKRKLSIEEKTTKKN